MKLSNFEDYINDTIFERGEGYFYEGSYRFMKRKGNQHIYQVYGYETYTTKIDLVDDVITSTSCDCPYDAPICKHIVCVLLDPKERDVKPISVDILKAEELINDLSNKVIMEEFLNILAEHPEYKQKFLLKYGEVQSKSLSQLVNEAFDASDIECDRHGFCDFEDLSNTLIELLRNLERTRSEGEMVILVQKMIEEVETTFDSEYGHTLGTYENDTFYFNEVASSYFDEYTRQEKTDKIENIVDAYVKDFYNGLDIDNASIPTSVLYDLKQLSYNKYAQDKMDEIINKILKIAHTYEHFTKVDFIFETID